MPFFKLVIIDCLKKIEIKLVCKITVDSEVEPIFKGAGAQKVNIT